MVLSEYEPGAAFPWVIGRATDVCALAWPQSARHAPGTTKVLVVVMDDTGFGRLGCVCGTHAAITPTRGLGDDVVCETYPAPVNTAVRL
jgi:hypothetical protein